MIKERINLTEMDMLVDLLIVAKIPFEERSIWGGRQVVYPNDDNRVCSVVCHSFSYGHEDGLLEIMGLCDEDEEDSVQGWLTALDVFCRIAKDYEEN